MIQSKRVFLRPKQKPIPSKVEAKIITNPVEYPPSAPAVSATKKPSVFVGRGTATAIRGMSGTSRVYPKWAKEEVNPFYHDLFEKVYIHHESALIVVSGPTGSGKTTLAVKFAEMFDRNFNKNTTRFPYKEVRKGKEVFVPRLFNSITAFTEALSDDYPIGTAFVIDEAQNLLNSRDFMTKKNKEIIKLVSTIRFRKFFIFLVLPFWEHIDNQIKAHINFAVNVSRADKKHKQSIYKAEKFATIKYKNTKIVITKHYRKRDNLYNRSSILYEFRENLPSYDLWMAQEKKVDEWKHLLHKGLVSKAGDVIDPFAPKDEKKKRRNVAEEKLSSAKKYAEELAPERDNYRKGTRYSTRIIATKFNISIEMARYVVAQLELMDMGEEPIVKEEPEDIITIGRKARRVSAAKQIADNP